jgi:hypothetical protein
MQPFIITHTFSRASLIDPYPGLRRFPGGIAHLDFTDGRTYFAILQVGHALYLLQHIDLVTLANSSYFLQPRPPKVSPLPATDSTHCQNQYSHSFQNANTESDQERRRTCSRVWSDATGKFMTLLPLQL